MSEEVQCHITKRYNLIKKVGSGAYGHVWKVTERLTGKILALKKIFDAFQHSTDAQRTYREIVFLHELDHPNIIKLHEVIRAENDKDLYLVFQYMEADLHNAISQKILKDIHNRFILYQLVKGIKFMHTAQLLHRDLKPSNILLNSDCVLKICDFGLARSLVNDDEGKDVVLTQQVATRWYRSPEVLLGSQNYDKSADIWSIGCIFGEMLSGKPIFPGNSTLNQLERIVSMTGKPKREDIQAINSHMALTMLESMTQIKQKNINQWFKSQVPQDALNLLSKLLQFNPNKRLTVNQILSHPYLVKFHNIAEEYSSKTVIHPPVSDNTKLGLKQYRLLIYDRIRKIYQEKDRSISPQRVRTSSITKKVKEYEKPKEFSPNSSYLDNQLKNKEPESQQKYCDKKSMQKKQSIKKNVSINNYFAHSPNRDRNSYHYQAQVSSQNQPINSNSTAKNYQDVVVPKQRSSCAVLKDNNYYLTTNTNTPLNQHKSHYYPTKTPQNGSRDSQYFKAHSNILEDEKIKKKNSLKQMLRNKKSSPSFNQSYHHLSNITNNINNISNINNINNINTQFSTTMPNFNNNPLPSNSILNVNRYYKNSNNEPTNHLIHKASITRY